MEFPSNSKLVNENKKAPVAEKKVEKITTGVVIQKKPALGSRFKSIFFGGEFRSAAGYITSDVLLPALKNLIVDATSKGIERVIYGDNSPRRRPQSPSGARVSYSSPVDRGYLQQRPTMLPNQPPHYVPTSRRQQTVGDIILSSRNEAEMVIERMTDIVDQFQAVSIADLYELVGLPSSYIDNNWGWTTLAYVNVRQTRDGYVIDLPPAESF